MRFWIFAGKISSGVNRLGKANKRIRILFTGGGTGGHLFPAVATAQAFRSKFPECSIFFIGTKRKVDERSLAAYGFEFENIRCYGLKGKNPFELLKAICVLPLSYVQALRIIRRFRPDVIVGVGGYVTGPVVAAGKSLGIPSIIHEQNSVPGLANRKLGQLVNRVCLSLPDSGDAFPADKIVYTGNPVRKKILELAARIPTERTGKKTILVLGGSQGAHGVNRLIIEALTSLSGQVLSGIRVIHQTGEKDAVMVEKAYKGKNIEAEVQPFFTQMHEVYGQADLLVSRAGATTLSELAVLGKPALLIPYPYAADNHQEKNSDYYVVGGGARKYNERDVTGEELADEIVQLIGDEEKLKNMGNSMRELAFPDAAEEIVACCLELVRSVNGK